MPSALRFSIALFALISVFTCNGVSTQETADLPIMQDQWPRAFFFRSAEGFAANPGVTYDRWDAGFSRLQGIMGKTLDEEVLGRQARNIEFFTRFKQNHPDQVVLLHLNGNARDPRYEAEKFFAGHFVYYNGVTILEDVRAEPGETTIRVADTDSFHLNMGRYRTSNSDIGLCMLDSEGHPDWHRSEQVQLIAVDKANKTITVRRGCYGTEPMALPAGKSYAAAHMTEGPWGQKNHIMWYYNYSTACPRDENGKTCADIWSDEIAGWYAPDGRLAAYDGLEFDVLHHRVGGNGRYGADCNADGLPDMGVIDGVNTYGVGVVEFCRQLREKMGPDRLIMADGMAEANQRAFGILNGIESEGWPHLRDITIRDWSGGLNRHFYWRDHSFEPQFNYINHKFNEPTEQPGITRTPKLPFSTHRLVMAAAMFTDSAICYSFAPPKDEPGELIGVWDELRMGTENRVGWLGRPLGAAVRMAETTPNVGPWELPVAWQARNGELHATLQSPGFEGQDLLVKVTARADTLKGFSPDMPRIMWVGIAPNQGQLITRDPGVCGQCTRGGKEQSLDTETGASCAYRTVTIGDETATGYQTHPPYKAAKGYTFWQRTVTIPEGGRLQFKTCMGPLSPERSDGVDFRVYVDDASSTRPATAGAPVFEHWQKAYELISHDVPLDEYAGKQVRLSFVADCGENDNATTDHAFWGDAVVVGPGGSDAWNEPIEHMALVGTEPGVSYFYFNDVKDSLVDLSIRVEGEEPADIMKLEAFASADLIYRAYEKGLVLANPSRQPIGFILDSITPGVRYRRLHGSPNQDPETNNGQPVTGGVITLGPMDAIFLVREK